MLKVTHGEPSQGFVAWPVLADGYAPKSSNDPATPPQPMRGDAQKMQGREESGASAPIRQSGSILDIDTAIFAASWCKAGLVAGALRIAGNGLCTAARFHTAEENPGCLLGRHDGLDCIRHYNRCPALFDSLCSLRPGAGECISPAAIFNELLFKIAVRSDRQTRCFPAPQAKDFFTLLPTCRITTRLTGFESPGWSLLTDGAVKRNIDGTQLPAGVLRLSRLKFCWGHLWPSRVRSPTTATSPLNSLVLLRLFVGLTPSFPAVLVCAFLTPNTRPVSRLALPTLRGTLRLPALATSFCYD